MAIALGATGAQANTPKPPAASREFWVRNTGGPSLSFRRAQASLRASGAHSLIYVENKVSGLTNDYLARLVQLLERDGQSGAYVANEGLLPLEETLWGPLPPSPDDRLIVLFAELGTPRLDGETHDYDQLSDNDAFTQLQKHSNEANVIYVNGFRRSESYTGGVIARELSRILTTGPTHVPRESWLADSLAEGAMLLTGFFGDQDRVDEYLQSSEHFSLVTPGTAQLGPQLLFSSFLLDTLPSAHGTALGALSQINLGGRDAAEKLFLNLTDTPLNFDAIFSNFVSYIFDKSAAGTALPSSWHHNPALYVQSIAPYFTYQAGSGELTGELAPYSFAAIDLAQELSPTAEIHVERTGAPSPSPLTDCAQNASVLWKPVNKTRIAVYAVGCEPSKPDETVQFRLKILDQPSLYPSGTSKLFR